MSKSWWNSLLFSNYCFILLARRLLLLEIDHLNNSNFCSSARRGWTRWRGHWEAEGAVCCSDLRSWPLRRRPQLHLQGHQGWAQRQAQPRKRRHHLRRRQVQSAAPEVNLSVPIEVFCLPFFCLSTRVLILSLHQIIFEVLRSDYFITLDSTNKINYMTFFDRPWMAK